MSSSPSRRSPRRGPLRIAITLGDPNGIGPEVAVKAAEQLRRRRDLALTLVGSLDAAVPAFHAFGRKPPRLSGLNRERPDEITLWDPLLGRTGPRIRPGRVDPACGRASVEWIDAAVLGCRTGQFDAVVTAPIHKEAWDRAGVGFPGHTELIADRCGVRRFGMLLQGGPLRVFLATRHLPLRAVADALTRPALRSGLELLAEALPWLGAGARPVAVCGLNPHAGDGGAIGGEDRDVIAPVVRALRRRGLPFEGPLPADTVFHHAWQGRYAAVAAMYHDQGLAPLKMMCFDTGVNITLGLPLVRTSPDHGTAFDIAWQGRASASSMVAAIETAAELAARPNPWRGDA